MNTYFVLADKHGFWLHNWGNETFTYDNIEDAREGIEDAMIECEMEREEIDIYKITEELVT